MCQKEKLRIQGTETFIITVLIVLPKDVTNLALTITYKAKVLFVSF